MRFIKKYGSVLIIPLLVLFLAGARFLSGEHFKPGAEKNASEALRSENIINTSGEAEDLAKYTVLLIGDLNTNKQYESGRYIRVDPPGILDDQVIKRIKNTRGPVLIIADDNSLAARAWMLLAQKGINDIYLGTDGKVEEFKYKFQPE